MLLCLASGDNTGHQNTANASLIPSVTAVCLFILIVFKKYPRTQDGDHQRGIPQEDINGRGHGRQMFAVKVHTLLSYSAAQVVAVVWRQRVPTPDP